MARKWNINSSLSVETSQVDGPHLIIARVGGGLVHIELDEAPRLAEGIQAAVAYLAGIEAGDPGGDNGK